MKTDRNSQTLRHIIYQSVSVLGLFVATLACFPLDHVAMIELSLLVFFDAIISYWS